MEESDKFDKWLSIHQTFSIKILLFSISEHVTLTFVKLLFVKILCVLHLLKFFPVKLLHYKIYDSISTIVRKIDIVMQYECDVLNFRFTPQFNVLFTCYSEHKLCCLI